MDGRLVLNVHTVFWGWRMRWRRIAVLCACLVSIAGATLAQPAGRPDPAWRLDRVWDDGAAEFCVYDVTWQRYGNAYPGRVVLVLVKEPWAPDLNVKADRLRHDGFDVLKLNHARDVPTGIYTYHQMASAYFRRDTGGLVKLAATSSELCGVATATVAGGRLWTRSYFDGQGDREHAYPASALPQDALPALLRDYVSGEPPREILVFPSLMMGRFARLEPKRYTVTKQQRPVDVPAGTYDVVEITLRADDDTLVYAFDARPPFMLVQFTTAAGTEYRLAKAERLQYWRMHDPGGEAWLPEHLR